MVVSESGKAGGRFSPVRSLAFVGGCMLGGAALMFAGCFLKWFQLIGEGHSLGVKCTDLDTGDGQAIVPVLVIGITLTMIARARKTGGRAWSITVLVLASLLLFMPAQAVLAPEASFTDWAAGHYAEVNGVSKRAAAAMIEEAFHSGSVRATPGIEAFVALVGSVLAAGGAILGIVWRKSFKRPEAPSSAAFGSLPPLPPPPPPLAPG
jgi:hypothetical protein